MKIPKSRFIAQTAVIAAVYAALTVLLAPISYGIIQIRISEALTFLPVFTPTAIPGLFVGCLISNFYTGNIIDIIFGSLTTLVASIATYGLRNKPWLAPMPPVLLNGVVVGYYLTIQHGGILWFNMLSIAAGQAVACYVVPVYFLINFEKTKVSLNRFLNH